MRTRIKTTLLDNKHMEKLVLQTSCMPIGHGRAVPDGSRSLPHEARMLAECSKLLTYKAKRLLRPPRGQVRSAILAELQLSTREVSERPHKRPYVSLRQERIQENAANLCKNPAKPSTCAKTGGYGAQIDGFIRGLGPSCARMTRFVVAESCSVQKNCSGERLVS